MTAITKIRLILFLLITFLSRVTAQQYSVAELQNLQLLSESYVYSIIQDKDAYLWIGTSDGLFRFDGINLKSFTIADSLADNFITNSCIAENGIWFGHINGSLSFYDGKKFVKIIPDVAGKSSITDFCQSNNNDIWASTFSGDLIKLGTDKSYQIFSINSSDISINTLKFIDENLFLIGSTDGLRYCKIDGSGKIEILRHFTEIPRVRIQSVLKKNSSEGFYIATANEGIYELNFTDNKFKIKQINSKSTKITDEIQCIIEDNKQNLWVGTFGGGLYRISISARGKSDETLQFNQESGFGIENIKTLFQDRDENIWTGNYGQGINRLSAQTFSIDFFDKSRYGERVNAIATDNKFKWIGTEKGLIKTDLISNSVIDFFSLPPETNNAEITGLYIQNEELLWIGTNGKGVFTFDTKNNKFENISLAEGALENTISSITGYRNIVWIGTKKGACQIDLNSGKKNWFTIYSNGLPHNSIRQIFIDSKSQVWIVTLSNTLYFLKNNKYEKIIVPSETATVTLESVAEDIHGNIWAGSSGQGIFLINSDSILNLTTREGLFSDYCYSLIGDKQGFMWVGHRGGISRINTKDLSVKPIQKYAKIEEDFEFISNSITCDKFGKIWFGFNKGLLAYDPDLENKEFLPPKVHLTSININNQEYAPNEKIKLIPGLYKIRFDFVGISLKEPDLVKYQYKLKGYDIDWSVISSNTSAIYQGLTEGTYIFEVNASSSDGIVTSTPATIYIVIKSPAWKSIWMYVVILVSLLSLIYFYNKNREQKHIWERRLLEEKVQERTIEIQRQKDEIEMQRDLINKKNTDITDSLKYARKIQSSIIPPDELLEKLLPDHFLINKPKDIVSGDFCWYTQTNDKTIVTVADCTGHGVPGAMMSILGLNSLNEIIINYGITDPSRVLEFLRLKVITSLSQHSKDSPSFDGINLALCTIDQQTLQVQFSGAINNMVHIQDGVLNLIKADRIPIGVSDLEHKPFTETGFQCKKGDIIYMYSDGYQDQFGGEREKKYSSKRFLELLFDIHKLPMNTQKGELEKILTNWMGDNEQTDDITILGFKL